MRMTTGHPTSPQHTPLFDLVFQRISESPGGAIPFSSWMEMALYDAKNGYYQRRGSDAGFREVGRTGDFYTSVSVGETFGFLLAHCIVREWETTFERALPFVLVEQGAHDGQLARDILAALRAMGTSLLEGLEYRLVEPRASLQGGLAGLIGDPLRVVSSLAEARASRGIFLCNELLDAFPVETLIHTGGTWCERWVGWDPATESPTWVTRPLRESFAPFTRELGDSYPEGYLTEMCPAVDSWMGEAAPLFEKGLWWIIDYGHERSDYYHPQRTGGTLRTYRNHQAGDDPFAYPGEQDLTAHVDFTRVEQSAAREGLQTRHFTDQHHFLIEAARPWLLSLEGRPPDAATAKRIRQFQTLTHPSMMGQRFKVMELAK